MKRLYKAAAAILSVLVLITGSSLINAMEEYEGMAEEDGLAYVTESSLAPLMQQQEAEIQPQEQPAPEMQAPEIQLQEQPAPEVQALEIQPQEQPAPEMQVPEIQPQEWTAPDMQMIESQPQVQPVTETVGMEIQYQEQPAQAVQDIENQPQEQPIPEVLAPEIQPQEQPIPEVQVPEIQPQEQPAQEPQGTETPTQIPPAGSEQKEDPENTETVFQLSVVPVKTGIRFKEEELSANTAYSEELEIKNISNHTMTDIEMTIWSEDGRFLITSFQNMEQLQTALNNASVNSATEEDAVSYRKRTLRIRELVPGASMKTEIILWAQENMIPDSPDTKAQIICEFTADGVRFACQGTWKIVPEEPVTEPETTEPEQTETEGTEQTETEEPAQAEGQQPEQTETEGTEQAETEEPVPEEGQQSEQAEQPETEGTEPTEVQEPVPEEEDQAEQVEATEPEQAEQKEEPMEDEIISFNIIDEEINGETGEEETPETDEYYEDYYYDDGSYYYDDWVVYDGVSGADQINTAVPYLLVKSYSHKRVINTGDEFGLEVTLLNTSQKLNIENVMIKIETSDSLSLSNGTNTLFVSAVGAGGTTTQSMNLQAASECKDASQKITLNITYDYVENKERKQGTATECITIPVSQQDRLELRDPVVDYMEAGQEGVISVSYVNKGFSSLYNMEATITLENAEAVQDVVYAGNVESGKSGTLDFLVTPLEEGDYTGEITLRYENASQKEVAVAIPLQFTSTMAYVADEYLYDEEDYMTEEAVETSSFPWAWVAAGGAALILAIVITVILARRKKKAKAGQDDMNDWYEILNTGNTGTDAQ